MNVKLGVNKRIFLSSKTSHFFITDNVSDTFAIFESEEECTSFFDALNSKHSELKFTFETEENDELVSYRF